MPIKITTVLLKYNSSLYVSLRTWANNFTLSNWFVSSIKFNV